MTTEELNAIFGNQSEKTVWGKENGIISGSLFKGYTVIFCKRKHSAPLYLPYLCNSTCQVPDC